MRSDKFYYFPLSQNKYHIKKTYLKINVMLTFEYNIIFFTNISKKFHFSFYCNTNTVYLSSI